MSFNLASRMNYVPSFGKASSHDRQELRDFFAESYERLGYLGDARLYNKLAESDGIVTLREKVTRGLAAASLIRGERITMIGTATDTKKFGQRLNNMTHLFVVCPIVSRGSWISIGEQYDRVQLAAHDANYYREGDGNEIEALLDRIDATDKYKIFYDEDLIPVIKRKEEPDGIAYPQQIWRSNISVER